MEETLENFLNTIGLDNDIYHDFNGAQILKVEYIESKKYLIIYLELDEVLPLDTYINLTNKLKEFNIITLLVIILMLKQQVT
ncbi:MAG: PolC-type DNA polymerase III N-terminal domain-containing protein [Erysipelotrichales bacterium]